MTAASTRGQVMLYDLHFRQYYALSTSDDPGNAIWKQRSSCCFPGRIMVYSRQRYALNHSLEEGLELRDEQISPKTFPWEADALLAGAVRASGETDWTQHVAAP